MVLRWIVCSVAAIALAVGSAQAQWSPSPDWPGAGVPPAKPKPPKPVPSEQRATPPSKPAKEAAPAREADPGKSAAMMVSVVRSAEPGCEPTCFEWIVADGQIVPGTKEQFKKVLAQIGIRKLPILIHSPGGSLDDSLAIGRMVRAKGLDVVVARTKLKPCPSPDIGCLKVKPRVIPALPDTSISYCASACVFVLAAGTRRLVGKSSVVGVHQIARVAMEVHRIYRVHTQRVWGAPVEVKRELMSERRVEIGQVEAKPTDSAYKRIVAFWAEMGIGPDMNKILMATPNKSMHWLTPAELVSTGIMTARVDGVDVVSSKPAAAPVTSPCPVAAGSSCYGHASGTTASPPLPTSLIPAGPVPTALP
jgi:hypothetical protein